MRMLPLGATLADRSTFLLVSQATVVVSRAPNGHRDRFRSYKVLIDGIEVGRLRRGEQLEAALVSGLHTLRIAIDWTRSETTFEVTDSERRHFICEPAGTARRGSRDLANRSQWVSIRESPDSE